MFVVDTNVLIYAANAASPARGPCKEFLERCLRQSTAWYSTWGIFYEFLRVATHPRVFPHPLSSVEAWRFLRAIIESPGFGMLVETRRHAAVVAEVLDEIPLLSGNLLHDAHTAILMREHGISRIYTRDTAFHRFPFIEVIDPLR